MVLCWLWFSANLVCTEKRAPTPGEGGGMGRRAWAERSFSL